MSVHDVKLILTGVGGDFNRAPFFGTLACRVCMETTVLLAFCFLLTGNMTWMSEMAWPFCGCLRIRCGDYVVSVRQTGPM